MPKITFSATDVRDPGDSQELMIAIEFERAINCDGSICGVLGYDNSGEPVEADPHFHLVESGRAPEASPRYHFIQFP